MARKKHKPRGWGKGYQIIIPLEVQEFPKLDELKAARYLIPYFESNIEFVPTKLGKKTPDFKINGVYWELKSPRNTAPKNISKKLRQALKQAKCIIIDLGYTTMSPKLALEIVERSYNRRKNNISRLIVIQKNHQIIELTPTP